MKRSTLRRGEEGLSRIGVDVASAGRETADQLRNGRLLFGGVGWEIHRAGRLDVDLDAPDSFTVE
jgi:hypothetical protein